MNAILFTVGVIAVALYCVMNVWIWRCYSTFYARYCYFPDYIAEQFPSLAEISTRPDPSSQSGISAIKSSMPRIRHDIRTRSGSARGFSPLLWWIPRVALILSFGALWFSRAGSLMLLIPLAVWLSSRVYFDVRGWRWLQRACQRAQAGHSQRH